MKKFLPIPLMLCLLFSLSSFAPVRPHTTFVKKAKRAFPFPITGTTFGAPGAGQPSSTIAYSISGSNTTPNSITFSTLSGTPIASYLFNLESPGNYIAVGMKPQTTISAVYFRISNNCISGYCVDIIGGD